MSDLLRSQLDLGDHELVAIVGAGYTGLWTAYYLALHKPELRLAIVERWSQLYSRPRPRHELHRVCRDVRFGPV